MCLNFDSFIERSCKLLGVDLSPDLRKKIEVERTENLTKNPRWIGNHWNGSDVLPGRYKHELKPDSIAFLSERYAPVLRAMARLDEDYAHLYLENVPPEIISAPPASTAAQDTVQSAISTTITLPISFELPKKAPYLRHAIVDRPDLRIDHFRNRTAGQQVVFTFTSHSNRDAAAPDRASEYLLGKGFDVIAIRASRDLRYENFGVDDGVEIERWLSWTTRPYQVRLGFGSDVDGYAAMRFSRLLRLDRVFALSPLFEPWEGDAAHLPSETAMFAWPGSHEPNRCEIEIFDRCDYLLAFDPLCPAVEHIRRFQHIIAPDRLQLLPLRYAGHPAGEYLTQLKVLGAVTLSALSEGRFPSIASARRQHRAQSSIHLFQLAEHCQRRGHLHWALAINERLIAVKGHPEYHFQASRILRGLGRHDQAIAAVDRALSWADYIFRSNIEKYRQDLTSEHATV